MAQVRREVHDWYQTNEISDNFSISQQKHFAVACIRAEYAEDKLAGILLFQEILMPDGLVHWQEDLPLFRSFFTDGYLYDWNLCDWFCVKVLNDILSEGDIASAGNISSWASAENLWEARASTVSFVYQVSNDEYYPLVLNSSEKLIQRPERFAKTAVGWLMRELSAIRKDDVLLFIHDNIQHFTAEVLNNSIKKLSADERKHYKSLFRDR